MDFQTHLIWSNFPFLIQGLWLTLAATVVALFIGIIHGGFFCALKLSKNIFANRLSSYYITFFRTTPRGGPKKCEGCAINFGDTHRGKNRLFF